MLRHAAIRRLIAPTSRVQLSNIKSLTTSSAASSETTRPRIIFSGIQPTGVPHVSSSLSSSTFIPLLLHLLTYSWYNSTARKLSRSSSELGRPSRISLSFGWLDFQHSWIARFNNASRSKDSPERKNRSDGYSISYRLGSREMYYLPSGWGEWGLLFLLRQEDLSDLFICFFLLLNKVPEHAELAWILNCITPFGKLNRMTTWKVGRVQGPFLFLSPFNWSSLNVLSLSPSGYSQS